MLQLLQIGNTVYELFFRIVHHALFSAKPAHAPQIAALPVSIGASSEAGCGSTMRAHRAEMTPYGSGSRSGCSGCLIFLRLRLVPGAPGRLYSQLGTWPRLMLPGGALAPSLHS